MKSGRLAQRMRGKSANKQDDYLPFPDFESDARKSVEEGSDHSPEKLQSLIDSKIDLRIRQLVGLYQHKSDLLCANSDISGRIKRASELTEDQLIDLVLDGNDNNLENEFLSSLSSCEVERENILAAQKKLLDEVNSMYSEQRQEQRELAKTYIEQNARHNNRFPWLLAEDPIQPTANEVRVRIDAHGRLVRGRDESNSNTAQAANNNQDDERAQEFVDAADFFWRNHSKQQHLSQIPIRLSTLQRNNRQALERIETDRQNREPLNSNQNEQHISEQMERDAKEAIDRALDRYKKQGSVTSSSDKKVFEHIPIPIVHTQNEINEARWFNIPRRDNDPAGNMNNANRNNPDLRLAFRRICLAVLTVVAAFICTILQDTSLFFEDGGVDVNSVWFTGLLGPHYEGHHARRPPRPQQLEYRLLREGGFVSREEMSRFEVLLNEMFGEEDHNDNDSLCVEEQDG